MLAKHSLLYVLARGLPGLVNFAALAVYTRLLSPEQYGQYAIVIALVGLLNMMFFEWLHLGLLRYLPAKTAPKPVFLSTVFSVFVIILVVCAIAGFCWYGFSSGLVERHLIIPGLLLLTVTGFFNLNLQLKSAQLQPMHYGRLSAGKSVISLIVGSGLVFYGFGAKGVLYALSLGMIVSIGLWARNEWRDLHFDLFDKALVRKLLIYGLPLSVNLAMAEIISSSDRFFLNWMHNEATTGLYAVGYDLASHMLGVLLMIINLAAYPLAVRALEQQGQHGAKQQLRQNLTLIVGISFPAAAGLAILAPGITGLLIGEQFQQAAQTIVPWVALAALLAGLKSYYFDMAFQLGQNTVGQLKVLLVAVVVNLVLNYYLIPDYSAMGAIYATLCAYAIGLVLSAVKGRQYFKLPLPNVEVIKITMATIMMGLALWPFHMLADALTLVISILFGALIYLFSIILMNVTGTRAMVAQLRPGRFSHAK
jgi:O-antigen/teichoic acid export membrane protein